MGEFETSFTAQLEIIAQGFSGSVRLAKLDIEKNGYLQVTKLVGSSEDNITISRQQMSQVKDHFGNVHQDVDMWIISSSHLELELYPQSLRDILFSYLTTIFEDCQSHSRLEAITGKFIFASYIFIYSKQNSGQQGIQFFVPYNPGQ